MNNPKLVILAAGMGSRYGGLKQMDSMDEYGSKIIDFSMYDAYKAGFRDIVFIIKNEIKDIFINEVGKKVEPFFNVSYVYQELDVLPEGFSKIEERKKPWGTAHAIYAARSAIKDSNFAVINSDDFYGYDAYKKIYDFLTTNNDDFAMVGYILNNTLTLNGSVARGVCNINDNGYLTNVVERTKIIKYEDSAAYTLDDITYHKLPNNTLVSMNFWGFNKSFFDHLEEEFIKFLNSDKCLTSEFYIPQYVDTLIKNYNKKVKMLNSLDSWFGVTYKEDKENVVSSIKKLRNEGKYPLKLWE